MKITYDEVEKIILDTEPAQLSDHGDKIWTSRMAVALADRLNAAALAEQTQQGVEVKKLEFNDLIEELLDAQQDINLAANSHMDQSLCDASALIDRVEAFLRRISALVDVPAVESEPVVKPDWWQDEEAAEREFTEYFVRNYPGPDTIIHDPNWHAPKLFKAAKRALLATAISTRKGSAGDGAATDTKGQADA